MLIKSKVVFFVFVFSVGLIIFNGCKKEVGETEISGGNETKISSYGENESHNMGQNCMSCHKSGGTGEGWFNIAGTVYDSLLQNTYPKATVKLYTGPNGTGTLKHTIQVDNKGNFYTTENVSISDGLFPAVEGNDGTQYMSSAIITGACNSCHGSSTSHIWTR